MRFQLLTLALVFTGMVQTVPAQEAKKEVSKKLLGLELGAKLPELMVTTQYGKEVPLAAAEDDRWVLVFFYPKALTGG